MNQGSGKPPPATARRRAMEEDAPLWRAPEWMQPGARETQEPHAQSYPQSVSAKQALSAALLTKLTAEQQKVVSAVQKNSGAWKEGASSSFFFAEKYAAAILNEADILRVLSYAQETHAKELAKTWNRTDRRLIEQLAKAHAPLRAGDLWIGGSLAQHTAVFVQIEPAKGPLDPKRTIVGHAAAKSDGMDGGTGEFQLLTLSQLHEFMLASVPGFALSDQWVLHRYLALKG